MLRKYLKLLIIVIADILITDISLVFSFFITGNHIVLNNTFSYCLVILPAILVICFYLFRIYNIIWTLSGYTELLHIAAATVASIGIMFVVQNALFNFSYTLNFYVCLCIIIVAFESVARLSMRFLYRRFKKHNRRSKSGNTDLHGNIMIIGAGEAASMIIDEITNNSRIHSCKVKCLIDDDISKKGRYISGIKVIGGREEIIRCANKYAITTILFAIANCPAEEKAKILDICKKTDCELRTIPAMYQLLDGKLNISSVRKVEIDDLLGRKAINLDTNSILNYVENQVVMVTGGGGSIGSELCRQIASHNPKQLIIFDVYENNAYDIQNEIKEKYPRLNLVTLIGSVRDSKRLECIFGKYKPSIVYHAAAHKHVPLMEDSPNETIKNNVFGTYKTAECASRYGVKKFILISTDKAVNPTNIMGASKRICEMIIQTFNNRSATDFVAVRFGNVLGSSGSVIPVFKNQIENGGPVTVTDPNIIRYFMTIPEAVSLVIQAGATAKGGEIFVLDMGEPVKILTLAENLIRLSGFTPYVDIPIEFTGLRPGEKLYEELLMSEEGLTKTDNSLIYIGKPLDFEEEAFINVLNEMKSIMYDDTADIRSLVKKIVPTYNYK